MHLDCPRCQRRLEYESDLPFFCAFCGYALSSTQEYTPDSRHSESVTQGLPDQFTISSALPPRQVGGYRLLRLLGQGGMGAVYEAEDVACGRHVALKLIAADAALSPEAVERFRQEGRLASTLAHPRCVFVLAADEEAGQPYLVMELMPGVTLQDLVKEKGPLEIKDAVAKILDVIEGLQEAHRAGIIHRDVKPSNCFLEADGRVKVGDFGLAKVLADELHLTKTGAFLGTPLYASPEQVRKDPLNEQSDVYSVAATLYFLLTGKAPFQGADMLATVARIIAEPAPSARNLRPDIPAALDRVILRGLERQRERRWRDLEEFRRALRAFLPGQLPGAPIPSRIAAFLIDLIAGFCLIHLPAEIWDDDFQASIGKAFLFVVIPQVFFYGYFVLLEGIWGCSLGKRLLRLRVFSVSGGPPGLARSCMRVLIYFAVVDLFPTGINVALNVVPTWQQRYQWLGALSFLWYVTSHLLLLVTVRAGNGYRFLHDVQSGTWVVRLPETDDSGRIWQRPLQESRGMSPRPADCPERIGPFHVRGVIHWTPEVKVAAGHDPALARSVWIWLRPVEASPVCEARRAINRKTRPRWLASGTQGSWQWDAFLAPSGGPLPALCAKVGRLSWAQTCPLLEEITEELVEACRERTLPNPLNTEQAWIQSPGRVQLLDSWLAGLPTTESTSSGGDGTRALDLVRDVSLLCLENRPRSEGKSLRRPCAPVPGYAAQLFKRLFLNKPPLENPEELRAILVASRDRPRQLSRRMRAGSIVVTSVLIFFFLTSMFIMPYTESVNEYRLAKNYATTKADLRLFILARMSRGSDRDVVLLALSPHPATAFAALVTKDADLRLDRRIEEKVNRQRSFTTRCFGPPLWQVLFTDDSENTFLDSSPWWKIGADFRQQAEADLTEEDFISLSMFESWILFVPVIIFPGVWVGWTFLYRGTLTYRMLGILVLRGDGREASRLQWAWRTLMVWLPLVVLLGLSPLFYRLYLSYWTGNPDHKIVWPYWAAVTSWILALVLLPTYVGLALWFPSRCLHDRLAGTYLVPK
jgi:uncharacterized RDD family membrane protein YckC